MAQIKTLAWLPICNDASFMIKQNKKILVLYSLKGLFMFLSIHFLLWSDQLAKLNVSLLHLLLFTPVINWVLNWIPFLAPFHLRSLAFFLCPFACINKTKIIEEPDQNIKNGTTFQQNGIISFHCVRFGILNRSVFPHWHLTYPFL